MQKELVAVVALCVGCATIPRHASHVAIDVETTGLSSSKHRIGEIGVVRFDGRGIIEQKSWLVNPMQAIPRMASRIHGIRDEMVADAPGFSNVVEEVRGFIGNATLVGHNVAFDLRFLKAEATRCSVDDAWVRRDAIDTLSLFRKRYPELEKHTLGAVAAHLGVEQSGSHRAEADAECTAKCLIREWNAGR